MIEMNENIKKVLELAWRFVKLNIKIVAGAVCLIAIIIAVIVFFANRDNGKSEIVLEDTPIDIQSVIPKGEIMVCSALIEDYAVEKKKERHLAFIVEEHTCIQILKMKCSFKIDLDKVQYAKEDTSNVVWVKLPPLEYQGSVQDSPFMSDDEEFWKEELPSTDKLKKRVEGQIKKRFDTAENRRKGERYAEDAISEVLTKLGYEVEFVRTIDRTKN